MFFGHDEWRQKKIVECATKIRQIIDRGARLYGKPINVENADELIAFAYWMGVDDKTQDTKRILDKVEAYFL